MQSMGDGLENWKTQIKKGYLELCLLSLINSRHRAYGLEIIDLLRDSGLEIKEGTLYPLLHRLSKEGILSSNWDMAGDNGHPRKFYKITDEGKKKALQMHEEFRRMQGLLNEISDIRRNNT